MSHSPPTSTSSASPPTPGPGATEDLGAVFRERRLRAAKLARFFGVGHGELFPVENGVYRDVRSSGSFDSIRSLHRDSSEKENRLTQVSVTVQRESDGEHASSSSCTAGESDAGSPELKAMTTIPSPSDYGAGAGRCYGSFGFGSSFTPNRSPSIRRRRGVGLGIGPGQSGAGVLAAFSLSRNSRASKVTSVVRDSVNVTLSRKGSNCSTKKPPTPRPLVVEKRRSILSRSSSTEFGVVDPAMKLDREPTYVRVGQKVADVNEVMAKLRELR